MIPMHEDGELEVVQRQDGSWLIEGGVTLARFYELFQAKLKFPDHEDNYHTLAGFVLSQLGRIPSEADNFEWNGFYFEVVDMDKYRIDRLLVKTPQQTADETESTSDHETE